MHLTLKKETWTHTTHRTVRMARRYAQRTPEQFERAAGKRLVVRNKAETTDGTRSGTDGGKVLKWWAQ